MGAKRIDGEIDRLDVGDLSLEVNNTKLEVGPSAMVLVDCKPANLSDLEEGSTVKAAYEEHAGRNVVTVIEAEKK